MRRSDRQVTDPQEILSIMHDCDVCYVAFFADEYPYVVPLNFGVQLADGRFRLFFHGADAGTKMALLRKEPHVAFSMSGSHNYIPGGEDACDATMEYESVCGNGTIRVVAEDEKIEALTSLMRQYEAADTYHFNPADVKHIAVLCLDVNEITGKRLRRKG